MSSMFIRYLFVVLALALQLPASADSSARAPINIELVVQGGKLASGPKVIRLKRGDAVSLSITSDMADELHVHGYNLHLHLKPNEPAKLEFIAKRTGRFGYELHEAGTGLGVFEIYPK